MNQQQAFYIYRRTKLIGIMPGKFKMVANSNDKYILIGDNYNIKKGDILLKSEHQAMADNKHTYTNKFYVTYVERNSDIYSSGNELKVYYKTEPEHNKDLYKSIHRWVNTLIAFVSLIISLIK